jgi:integrase
MGRLKGTKTGAERTVRLLAPLAHDLAEWRLVRGHDPEGIVFPGDSPAGALTEGQWNRWTQGTFRAAKLAAGLPTARAYDLRHSFVSLLIHEGQSILEVARQAGHSPQTCLRDYRHLFDEFDPAKREPAEAVINAARASSYLSRSANRRKAARRAERPYRGISQSGNQRVMSSSNGSSVPSWAFRRSSRSESRALSPLAGTNG